MRHVLVVEDDPFTARMPRHLLMARGVRRITHAATVASALELLVPPPDWAILGMNLPDGLGVAVLQAIRSAGLPIRVIIATSTTNADAMAIIAAYEPDLVLPQAFGSRLPAVLATVLPRMALARWFALGQAIAVLTRVSAAFEHDPRTHLRSQGRLP